jgi:DNA-binding response OmpR family regulator
VTTTSSFVGHALVIESDQAYRAVIETCARLSGCDVEAMSNSDDAVARLGSRTFDLVVWGVSQRESENGRVEVLTALREQGQGVPVIMIDDHFEPAQLSYEVGADHVLPKPFVPGALVGSIKSALRKAPSLLMQLVSSIDVRGMFLDADRRRLSYGSQQVSLTRQEWELLSVFLTHPNRFLTVSEIFELGWRPGGHGRDQLRGYVHRLRQKLEPLHLPCQLVSQQGRGYCLVID